MPLVIFGFSCWITFVVVCVVASLTLKLREFRIRDNAPKTKENDVKTILFSLAYLTPIKLSFCMSTGTGLPSGQCYKHHFSFKKKKKKKKKNRSEPILQSK